jgi:hypothetical protein
MWSALAISTTPETQISATAAHRSVVRSDIEDNSWPNHAATYGSARLLPPTELSLQSAISAQRVSVA